MTRPALLLCTDMDRTLLPNGDAEESPQAMNLLSNRFLAMMYSWLM